MSHIQEGNSIPNGCARKVQREKSTLFSQTLSNLCSVVWCVRLASFLVKRVGVQVHDAPIRKTTCCLKRSTCRIKHNRCQLRNELEGAYQPMAHDPVAVSAHSMTSLQKEPPTTAWQSGWSTPKQPPNPKLDCAQ